MGPYGLGLVVMALGGVFVPILTGSPDHEAAVAAATPDRNEAREALAGAEADETDLPAQLRAIRGSQAQFELYADREEQWWWRLRHRNGNVIADSGEGYSRRNDANQAVEWIRTGVADMESEVYEDAAGEHRWRLMGGNRQIVADSGEGYVDESDAEEAIDRVRELAPEGACWSSARPRSRSTRIKLASGGGGCATGTGTSSPTAGRATPTGAGAGRASRA